MYTITPRLPSTSIWGEFSTGHVDAILERVEVLTEDFIKAYAVVVAYSRHHPFDRRNDVLCIDVQRNSFSGFGNSRGGDAPCTAQRSSVSLSISIFIGGQMVMASEFAY